MLSIYLFLKETMHALYFQEKKEVIGINEEE